MSFRRQKFMQALESRSILILRQGGSHTVVVRAGGRPEPVPRHREINRITTRKIAKNLEISWDQFEQEIR